MLIAHTELGGTRRKIFPPPPFFYIMPPLAQTSIQDRQRFMRVLCWTREYFDEDKGQNPIFVFFLGPTNDQMVFHGRPLTFSPIQFFGASMGYKWWWTLAPLMCYMGRMVHINNFILLQLLCNGQ